MNGAKPYSVSVRRWLRNPIVIVVPLVAILVLAWQQYTDAGRNLNLATPERNLLAAANFEQAPSSEGLLPGWALSHSGEAAYAADRVRGHVSGDAMQVTVDTYTSGDVTLTTPEVTLQPKERYLFKGYYTTDERLTLLARYFYADGSDKLMHVRSYPADRGVWSMAGHAFETGDRITGVQFIYKLAGTGSLTVEGVYLEPKQQVYIAPQPQGGENTIPNSALTTGDINMPTGWTTLQSGDNAADFSFLYGKTGVNIGMTVRDYEGGEAKWQYTPQTVEPHQYYRFSAAYRSNAPAKVVAEYIRQDGTRQFETIAELLPAGEWTDLMYDVEVPNGAASMVIAIALQTNGSLASRGYTLTDVSKSGAAEWRRPLVSITIDDGWESTHDTAAPLLDQYGFRGTFYINPLSIETPGFMTGAELTELREAGHEIGAHGYSHEDMTAISPDALDHQLGEGKDYLAAAGLPTDHFAPPYGKSDAEVQWSARRYFETLRGYEHGINTRQNLDPYNLKVLYVESGTPAEAVTAALNKTKQSNGWLILVYHYIGSGQPMNTLAKAEHTTLLADAFANHLALVQDSGMAVRSVGAAYAEVSKQ